MQPGEAGMGGRTWQCGESNRPGIFKCLRIHSFVQYVSISRAGAGLRVIVPWITEVSVALLYLIFSSFLKMF